MMSTILSTVAVLIALLAVGVSLRAVLITREKSVRAISLRRMTKLESEMTDLVDSLTAIRKAMHKMRSRQNMQRLRNGSDVEEGGEPDAEKEPEAWYRWARAKHLSPSKGK